MVFILRTLCKVAMCAALLLSLCGCDNTNYFAQKTTEDNSTEETETTIFPTIDIDNSTHIFPDSVFDYNVEDTILVPKN